MSARGVRITMSQSRVEGRGWLWSISVHGGPKERWSTRGKGMAATAGLALRAVQAIVAREIDPRVDENGDCLRCGQRLNGASTANRCDCTAEEWASFVRTRIG